MSPPKLPKSMFLASVSKRHMKGIKVKGHVQLCASSLGQLRAWQRQAKNKRCPLATVAKRLNLSLASLRALLRRRSLSAKTRCAQAASLVRSGKGTAKRRVRALPLPLQTSRSYRSACRDSYSSRKSDSRRVRARVYRNRVRPEEIEKFASQGSDVERHARRLGY